MHAWCLEHVDWLRGFWRHWLVSSKPFVLIFGEGEPKGGGEGERAGWLEGR